MSHPLYLILLPHPLKVHSHKLKQQNLTTAVRPSAQLAAMSVAPTEKMTTGATIPSSQPVAALPSNSESAVTDTQSATTAESMCHILL